MNGCVDHISDSCGVYEGPGGTILFKNLISTGKLTSDGKKGAGGFTRSKLIIHIPYFSLSSSKLVRIRVLATRMVAKISFLCRFYVHSALDCHD